MSNARIAPKIASRITLIAAALLLGAAAPNRAARPAQGTPVVLQEQRGTPLAATARQLVAQDLADAHARGDKPVVLAAAANLGAERPALFVQLQSSRECGSAGCSTAAYQWERGAYKRVLDGATGKITISPKRTKGRFDVLAGDDHYVWTGAEYRSLTPAPALDLRPHQRRR